MVAVFVLVANAHPGQKRSKNGQLNTWVHIGGKSEKAAIKDITG
ncbi:MAG: hypothetical protein ACJAZ9_001234 [Neolewinella sp.]